MGSRNVESADSAIKQTPLSIIKKTEHGELSIAKLMIEMDDGNYLKKEVPMTDGTDIETFLYCKKEFDELAAALGFDADNKFTQYRQTLKEPLRTQWDSILVNVNNKTNNTFKASVTELMETVAPEDAYERFEDYLDVIKKPRRMTPTMLANRLKVLNLYSKYLPSGQGDEVEPLSDRRLVIIFYRMMPTAYQHQFKRAGKSLGSQTLKGLATYFDTLQSLEPTERTKKYANKSQNQRTKQGPRKAGRSYRGKDKENNGGERQDSPCPIHVGKGHPWGDCSRNPKSKNYNNEKFLPASERRGNRGSYNSHSRSNKNNGDTMAAETTGDAPSTIDTRSSRSNSDSGGSKHATFCLDNDVQLPPLPPPDFE